MSKIVPRNSYCDNLNHMCSPQGVKFNIVPKIYNTCEKKLPLAVLSRNTKVITDTAAARACPNMTPGEKTLSNCPNQVQYNMHRDTPKQFRSLIMSTAVLGRCAIWQGTSGSAGALSIYLSICQTCQADVNMQPAGQKCQLKHGRETNGVSHVYQTCQALAKKGHLKAKKGHLKAKNASKNMTGRRKLSI